MIQSKETRIEWCLAVVGELGNKFNAEEFEDCLEAKLGDELEYDDEDLGYMMGFTAGVKKREQEESDS